MNNINDDCMAGMAAATLAILLGTILGVCIVNIERDIFLISRTNKLLLQSGLTNLKYKDISDKDYSCTQWEATEFEGFTKTVCLYDRQIFIPVEEVVNNGRD